jgi:diguanylate cyclase (GGDEF)-like protein
MLRTLASTQRQAQTDPLTGLLNRRSFEAEVSQRLSQNQSQKHVVVLADLDHFKRLNDTEGHEAGDDALRLFAEVMRQSLRPKDVIGRHGGEEFVIFLEGCQEKPAGEVLGRLRNRLRDSVQSSGGPEFTASFGMATAPQDGAALPALLRKADRALYEAKRRGRDCVVHFSELSTAPAAPLGSATIQLPEEEAVLLTVHKPQAKIEHSHNLDVSLS